MEKPNLTEDKERESSKWDENFWFNEAVEMLKIAFGVENLSNIELSHLRRITKDTLNRVKKDNSSSDLAIINPREEIPVRFLQELYGIEYFHMKENIKNEKDEEGFLEYIKRTRERSHLI